MASNSPAGIVIRDGVSTDSHHIARGGKEGSVPLHKFGVNTDIDTGTDPETVWSPGGVMGYIDAQEIHNFSSSSAADAGTVLASGTATGGTPLSLVDTAATFVTNDVSPSDVIFFDSTDSHGVIETVSETMLTVFDNGGRTPALGDEYRVAHCTSTGVGAMAVEGLDGDFNFRHTHIVPNGTSDVPTDIPYLRIFRMFPLVVGGDATGTNVGVLTLADTSDGTTRLEIRAAIGQTEMAAWTVPAGKKFFLKQFWAYEGNNQRAIFRIYHRARAEVFRPAGPTLSCKQSSDNIVLELPMVFRAKHDIQVRCFVDTSNASVGAGFEGWYEDA